MSAIGLETLLAWLLAAFFALGAAINLVAPRPIRDDYARWGYPDGFFYVTAALEFATAILLIVSSSRLFGVAIGAAAMAAATGTTLFYREYKRAVAPAIALVLTLVLGSLAPAGG